MIFKFVWILIITTDQCTINVYLCPMPTPKTPKTHSPQDALAKAMSFCAYQERSRKEVRDKLYSLGLEDDDEVESLLRQAYQR